jgi:RNA polymerase sigma factor (sigma-70 family)
VSDASTFEQIVRDHQQMVFRTLARLLGPRIQQTRLEDLAQDVFLRLFRALPNFRGDAQITTYLYRIALNIAHDEANRSRREARTQVSLSAPIPGTESDWESRLEHPAPNALTELEQDEFAHLVEAHLQALSHTERSILILFHQEDQTYEQIASALTMPINTVRTHLHRARKKLREALQPAPRTVPLSSKVKTA